MIKEKIRIEVKHKKAIINFLIVMGSFISYLLLAWNKSGGDIFLWFLFLISLGIHSIIVFVVFLKRTNYIIYSFGGMAIALVVCLLIFKAIEYNRAQMEPKVETLQLTIAF
jgi:hypothetical protein